MSASGSYGAGQITIPGGNAGNYIFVNWQIASQNVGGNYTTINYQIYFHFNGDDAQLDNGYTNTNVGTVWNSGGRNYNFSSNYSTRDIGLRSSSFTVGADANGNSQLQFGLGIDVYQSGNSNGTSGVWNLDRMALAPGIQGIIVDTIKPTSARLGGEITGYGHGTSANMNMYIRLYGSGAGFTDLGNQGDVAGYNFWYPTGLLPGKTYEYVMNVWNNNGDFSQSAYQTFKTQAVSGMISVISGLI
jgi:hypothetical protein